MTLILKTAGNPYNAIVIKSNIPISYFYYITNELTDWLLSFKKNKAIIK